MKYVKSVLIIFGLVFVLSWIGMFVLWLGDYLFHFGYEAIILQGFKIGLLATAILVGIHILLGKNKK